MSEEEEKFYLCYVRNHAGRLQAEFHRGLHRRDQKPVKVEARYTIDPKHKGFDLDTLQLIYPHREAKR